MSYEGARFFKCDLQMHTPADRSHWQEKTALTTEKDSRTAAEAYIRRCYEIGLEVIAITDHNFASKDFISLLKDAIARLKGDHAYEIVLFPGFEVQGPIGRGAHLLCLFEPESDLEAVDSRLSQLGLPPDRRFQNREPLPIPTSDMTFARMLELVQEDETIPGICIGAHPNNDGVLDCRTVEQWWSQEVIENEDFLCTELPRPRNEYVEKADSSLVKSILLNMDDRYKRRRPIATVCSSDCKKLQPDGDSDTNYIGFRHTWIRMSHPSIESLRQAFLDHEARIQFGDVRPELTFTFPKVRSITVQGASFLEDLEVDFSSNLNAIIGGRGTGKSTIIEYLRVALSQEVAIRGEDPSRNFQRLKATIKTDTSIAVALEKEGQRIKAESRGGVAPVIVEGPQAPDLGRFFPVRILSQKESIQLQRTLTPGCVSSMTFRAASSTSWTAANRISSRAYANSTKKFQRCQV